MLVLPQVLLGVVVMQERSRDLFPASAACQCQAWPACHLCTTSSAFLQRCASAEMCNSRECACRA